MKQLKKFFSSSSTENQWIISIGLFCLFFIYIYINFKTLTLFPLLHSDETWLGGLSLEYLSQKNPFVTEPFFDLFPRTPHLIKLFFHSLQAGLIALFGYSLSSLRLLSLVFSVLSLILLYNVFLHLCQNSMQAFFSTSLLATHIQFLYSSHLARQEIILMALLILSYFFLLKRRFFYSGLCVGIATGFHPNAFILASMIGPCLLHNCFHPNSQKLKAYKPLIIWCTTVLSIGLLFPLITLFFHPTFITDYFQYGQTLNVDATLPIRFQNYIAFYQKLFYQISGTYYLPNIQSFFYSFFFLVFSCLFTKTYKKKYWQHSMLMIIGFNISLFIIGRYNPTSILFIFFPWVILISLEIPALFQRFIPEKRHATTITICCFVFINVVFSLNFITEVRRMSYSNYTLYSETIKHVLPGDGAILGNLSSGFAFEGRDFYDIRNLAYLDNMTIEDYINTNNIKTIVYYEEYDYIHRNPIWTILYGDDTVYYEDLRTFLHEEATEVYCFDAPFYGTRIIRYMGDYPWKVWVYFVDP